LSFLIFTLPTAAGAIEEVGKLTFLEQELKKEVSKTKMPAVKIIRRLLNIFVDFIQ